MPLWAQSSRRIFPISFRSVPKIAFWRYFGTMTMWYRQYHRTWLWFCHSRMMWFLLCMALAGPWWEKPYLSSPINAGTAEPFRVSPPEAVAYPLELMPVFLSPAELDAFGEALEHRRSEIFKHEYLPHAQAFPQVRELVERDR